MTEKNYNPEQGKTSTIKQQKSEIANAPIKKDETKKSDDKMTEIENKKVENKVEEKKMPIRKNPVQKKDEAVVNGVSVPISTKVSMAICKFIKRKSIDKAISDLEEVAKLKKVIPMVGEIPHKKGKGIMSGRYPIRAVGFFIRMLKDLKANANVNGVEDPIIVEAVPNKAARPFGRMGAIKRKRTHIKIKVTEKGKLKNKFSSGLKKSKIFSPVLGRKPADTKSGDFA